MNLPKFSVDQKVLIVTEGESEDGKIGVVKKSWGSLTHSPSYIVLIPSGQEWFYRESELQEVDS